MFSFGIETVYFEQKKKEEKENVLFQEVIFKIGHKIDNLCCGVVQAGYCNKILFIWMSFQTELLTVCIERGW